MKTLSRSDILNRLFDELKSISGLSYSFKGGFIVGNFFFDRDSRYTTDLDMSISSPVDFNKIIERIVPILEEYKRKGLIFKNTVRKPRVTDIKNVSGNIKIYKK